MQRVNATKRMRFDEFLVWGARQDARYELVDGFAVQLLRKPRATFARRFASPTRCALRVAVERAGAPCEAFGDGLTVRILAMHAPSAARVSIQVAVPGTPAWANTSIRRSNASMRPVVSRHVMSCQLRIMSIMSNKR